MKKIVLVDGNSLLFRAYYATAYSGSIMRNKDGLYTNAVFAFSNIMSKLQNEEKSHLFVAFDTGEKTFRHKAYDAYKGTRKAAPDELIMQIPYVKEYLDVLGIKHLSMGNYEADDLIATVAKMAENASFDEIKIVSSDKDLLQLVRGNVKVFLTKKGYSELDEYNKDNFYEKMQIHPEQVIDYKGLVGDSSDNLPGIRGIGEVSALKLLNQFNSLEAIISNINLLKGKQQSLISEGYKQGLESKSLATLEANIDLDLSLDDLVVKDVNVQELISFYKMMGFDSLVARLDVVKKVAPEEKIVFASLDFDFTQLKETSLILEVSGKDYSSLEIIGAALTNENNNIFASKEVILKNPSFKKYLEGKEEKIVFDFKKYIISFAKYGFKLNSTSFDTLLAAYIINPNKASEDYKQVLDSFLPNDLVFDSEAYHTKSRKDKPSIELIANQTVAKARWNRELKLYFEEELRKNKQEDLFNLEMNLSVVLANIEENGLLLNRKVLKEIEEDLLVRQEEIVKEIYTEAKEDFNINSPKQLGIILFEKMAIPSGKKNKTGYSTAADVLEKLAPNYPFVAKILDYRAITKIITTYINGMYEVMDDFDYIHPLYRQALTVTGRLSSISPNIQNMPIRTELGQVIRKAFVSRFPEGKIMSSDYSQIELRILAHLSGDDLMQKMFRDEVDFHRQTAAEMYEVPLADVSPEMRYTAKAINFGIIYGISSWGLAKNVNISSEQAEKFINKYFQTFPKVKTYLDKTIKQAYEDGFTKTILNRVRFIPELTSENKALQAFGERTAMNSPIQGSAADLIKIAMIAVNKGLEGYKSKMIAQVHDELLFDIYPGEEELVAKLVKEKMEKALSLDVPLLVEIGFGDNWLNAK